MLQGYRSHTRTHTKENVYLEETFRNQKQFMKN